MKTHSETLFIYGSNTNAFGEYNYMFGKCQEGESRTGSVTFSFFPTPSFYHFSEKTRTVASVRQMLGIPFLQSQHIIGHTISPKAGTVLSMRSTFRNSAVNLLLVEMKMHRISFLYCFSQMSKFDFHFKMGRTCFTNININPTNNLSFFTDLQKKLKKHLLILYSYHDTENNHSRILYNYHNAENNPSRILQYYHNTENNHSFILHNYHNTGNKPSLIFDNSPNKFNKHSLIFDNYDIN